jgi:hypothetical protein
MRRRVSLLVFGAIVLLGASPDASPGADRSPAVTPAPTAWPVDLEAHVAPSTVTLAVTKAFADSIDAGIHLVPVRIVDAMDVTVTLLSEGGVSFSEAPSVCLAWRDAAPDDAGLESPCWGEPDLSSALAEQMATDRGWALEPGHGVAYGTTISRAPGTCDYPPGEWVLRLRVVPESVGIPQEPLFLRTSFEVPFEPDATLPDVPFAESRFCGLASEVIVEQGGMTPSPTPAR